MNRERKYRAWDGKQMYLSPALSEGSHHFGSWFEAHSAFGEEGKESEFMEWTGLNDKDGNQIYEGDIIKFYYWSTYEQRSFPEYIDFVETELKEGHGVVYFDESELQWYIKPDDSNKVSYRSGMSGVLGEMPLIYAGVEKDDLDKWISEAENEEYLKYNDCHLIEVIGNIYQHPLLNKEDGSSIAGSK